MILWLNYLPEVRPTFGRFSLMPVQISCTIARSTCAPGARAAITHGEILRHAAFVGKSMAEISAIPVRQGISGQI